jgi:hypothetical protein
MLRYATYRTRVYTALAMATGIDPHRLPPAALSALPDHFRAGLSPHNAAGCLLTPGPAPTPFPRRLPEDSSAVPRSLIPDPLEEQ